MCAQAVCLPTGMASFALADGRNDGSGAAHVVRGGQRRCPHREPDATCTMCIVLAPRSSTFSAHAACASPGSETSDTCSCPAGRWRRCAPFRRSDKRAGSVDSSAAAAAGRCPPPTLPAPLPPACTACVQVRALAAAALLCLLASPTAGAIQPEEADGETAAWGGRWPPAERPTAADCRELWREQRVDQFDGVGDAPTWQQRYFLCDSLWNRSDPQAPLLFYGERWAAGWRPRELAGAGGAGSGCPTLAATCPLPLPLPVQPATRAL